MRKTAAFRAGPHRSRRSPRLATLPVDKTHDGHVPGLSEVDHSDHGLGLPFLSRPRSRTRTRSNNVKSKLLGPSASAAAAIDKRPADCAGHSLDDVSQLPEKRVLELILDVLQRKDAFELFAEPVDPSEVEDYYKIISEPMDFGTMRAKLHEGMYKNLQEFENDVFQIFRNAMYFNSSATIYFRQARVLEDLAKTVFHLLRIDPKRFEWEFSPTRRRSTRKTSGGRAVSNLRICSKGAKRSASSSMRNVDATLRGKKVEKGHDVTMEDRRSTYIPSPIIYCGALPLDGLQDIGNYQESLMSFVKGLGPTAQRVARRKLQACWDASLLTIQNTSGESSDPTADSHHMPTASPIRAPSSSTTNLGTTADIQDDRVRLGDNGKVDSLHGHALRMDHIQRRDHNAARNINYSMLSNTCYDHYDNMGVSSVRRNDLAHANKPSNHAMPLQAEVLKRNPVHSFDLNQLNCNIGTEPELHNSIESKSSRFLAGEDLDEAAAASGTRLGMVDHIETGNHLRGANEAGPSLAPGTKFLFDLPYLESRLNEMNYSLGRAAISDLNPILASSQTSRCFQR